MELGELCAEANREMGSRGEHRRAAGARLLGRAGAEAPGSSEGKPWRRESGQERAETKRRRPTRTGEEDAGDVESRGPVATASLRTMERREGAGRELGTRRSGHGDGRRASRGNGGATRHQGEARLPWRAQGRAGGGEAGRASRAEGAGNHGEGARLRGWRSTREERRHGRRGSRRVGAGERVRRATQGGADRA
jgi:hypothetical protein